MLGNAAIKEQSFNGTNVDVSEWPKSKLLISPRLGFNWDIKGDRSIVLATDGYFDLYGTLQETEQALCHQIETDPLCIGMGCDKNNKSTKGVLPGNCSFDDRTYVRISCF